MKALVLIKVEPGKLRDVFKAVRDMRNVTQAYGLTGPDDLIVMLEADDAKKVSEVILADLHTVDGVRGTDTRMVVELD